MGVTRRDAAGPATQKIVLIALLVCLAATTVWLIHRSGTARRPEKPLAVVKPQRPLEERLRDLMAVLEKEDEVPAREDCIYTVEPGDSLTTIAKKLKSQYDLAEDPNEIRQGLIVENDIEDPKLIQAGSTLIAPLSQFVKPPSLPAPDYRFESLFRPFGELDKRTLIAFTGETPSREYDPTPKVVLYTVRKGENLYSIARKIKNQEKLGISLMWFIQEIAMQNDVEDPRSVHAGTELEIVLSDKRTMAAMLSYEGFEKAGPVLKLYYTKKEIELYVAKALKRFNNIPPDMFRRMLNVESGGNHLAVSPVGAAGLMQIMPLTGQKLGMTVYNEKSYIFPSDIGMRGAKAFYQRYARELQNLVQTNPRKLMQLDDRFNPQKNIMAAARYLSRLISMYGERSAVAVYNGGHRGLSANKPRETQAYMRLVLR